MQTHDITTNSPEGAIVSKTYFASLLAKVISNQQYDIVNFVDPSGWYGSVSLPYSASYKNESVWEHANVHDEVLTLPIVARYTKFSATNSVLIVSLRVIWISSDKWVLLIIKYLQTCVWQFNLICALLFDVRSPNNYIDYLGICWKVRKVHGAV